MIEEKLTIVLVGGLAMRASDFSSLVGSLAHRGIKAIVYDNLDVGGGPSPGSLSIQAQAEHGWSNINAIFGRDSRVNLFGISMGGTADSC